MKFLALIAMLFPLSAASTSTARFNCPLNHGGFAVFHVTHQSTLEGVAHYHKPSGGQWIKHLRSVPCVSPAGCLVGAVAGGMKGWKLDSIVEHAPTAPVFLELKKCR